MASHSLTLRGLQLKQILSSDADAVNVYEEARNYISDQKIFFLPVDFNFTSQDQPFKIHFSKIQSSNEVCLTLDKGEKMIFNSKKLKSGNKNFILPEQSSVRIQVLPKPPVMRLSYDENEECYKASEFLDRIKKLDLKIQKIACAHNITMLLTVDGHVYGTGRFKLA